MLSIYNYSGNVASVIIVIQILNQKQLIQMLQGN